jgi:hypothetical protein
MKGYESATLSDHWLAKRRDSALVQTMGTRKVISKVHTMVLLTVSLWVRSTEPLLALVKDVRKANWKAPH